MLRSTSRFLFASSSANQQHQGGFHYKDRTSTNTSFQSSTQSFYNALNTLGLAHSENQQLLAAQQQQQKQKKNLTPAMLKQAYLRKAVTVHPDTAKQHQQQNQEQLQNNANTTTTSFSDPTKEFQELGEALSIAMRYVQQQQHNFANLRDGGGGSGSSSSSSFSTIQEDYLQNLKDLADISSSSTHRNTSSTTTTTTGDHLDSLQQVVSSCSNTRRSFRQIQTVSDSMAERLCGRRSFDCLNLFSPNLMIDHEHHHHHPKQQQRHPFSRPTTIEDCAKAFNLVVTVLPNIVARLRRTSTTTTTSSNRKSSINHHHQLSEGELMQQEEDIKSIQTAQKFGFQPCVLIGGVLLHDGDYCGLLTRSSTTVTFNRSDDDDFIIDDLLLKKLLVRQNIHMSSSSSTNNSNNSNSTNADQDANNSEALNNDLKHQTEGKLAQRLLKVHPELICAIGLKSLLPDSAIINNHTAAENNNNNDRNSSFKKRTEFLDRITPVFFEWQIRSARRLKTENRLLVACRSLALEVGAILPELSCIPDLNLSNEEAEKFADRIEDTIIAETNDDVEEREGTKISPEQRNLLVQAGEKLDAKPHLLSPQSLRRHMTSCILVDDKQFDTLVMTVTGRKNNNNNNNSSNDPSSSAANNNNNNQHQNDTNNNNEGLVAQENTDEEHSSISTKNNIFSTSSSSSKTSFTNNIINIDDDPHKYGVLVTRARHACRIEDQQFEVIIRLGETPSETATHFINAANILHYKCHSSFEALPTAVADREGSLVQCISRVFTMTATEEKVFWEHVKRRSEFLRAHECRISNIDVHFLSTSSSSSSKSTSKNNNEDEFLNNSNSNNTNNNNGEIGWCDSQPDGEKVTLNKATLSDSKRFDDWLEDAVAQCTLSRQANLLAQRFSLFYVSRDRNLLLPHYISFLNRYIDSAARNVIETPVVLKSQSSRNNHNNNSNSNIKQQFTPVEVIVGHHLEMKQDGSLVVPWDFDLSLLVSLLSSDSTRERVLTV